MANVLVQESALQDIADAIRTKNGTQNTYKPAQMAEAIEAISGGGITPTGTKQISITANGTTTEDVTNYASAEITVNVSGGSSAPPRLLQFEEVTLQSTATSSNPLSVQLMPVESYSLLVMIDTFPSAPDASEYIALVYTNSKFPGNSAGYSGSILRPAGTIGSDGNMASFNNTTGVLSLGGSYGHYMAGTKYNIYLFEMGVTA